MKTLPPPLQDEVSDPLPDSAWPPVRCWSAQEIAHLPKHRSNVSPWHVVAWQWAILVMLTVVSALIDTRWVVSVAWGAMCAALPTTVMAWGLREHAVDARSIPAAAHLLRIAVWELVKIALAVMLLISAHWVIPAVNWLALVLAFAITLKVILWVALRGGLRQAKSEPLGKDKQRI